MIAIPKTQEKLRCCTCGKHEPPTGWFSMAVCDGVIDEAYCSVECWDDGMDEEKAEYWCEHCHGTGELDCHCGGDLCVCERNGTYPCPHCDS